MSGYSYLFLGGPEHGKYYAIPHEASAGYTYNVAVFNPITKILSAKDCDNLPEVTTATTVRYVATEVFLIKNGRKLPTFFVFVEVGVDVQSELDRAAREGLV